MTVLQLRPEPEEPEETRRPVAADETPPVSSARAWLERRPPLPTKARAKAVSGWWLKEGSKKLLALAIHSPAIAWGELRPIVRGACALAGLWSRWCFEADVSDRMAKADSHSEKHAIELMRKRSAHRKLSLAILTTLVGAGWVTAVLWPEALIVAGLLFLVVCDLAGRKKEPLERTAPPPPTESLWKAGVPLGRLRAAIIERAATRWGLELGLAREMSYSPIRRECEMHVTCAEPLTEEHERDFERAIGVPDRSLRIMLTDDETSNVRRLVIRDGDPLNFDELPKAPWRDTGSESFSTPRLLGIGVGELPFEIPMAGQHGVFVGSTGSGKSTWALRNMINACMSCHNVQLYGIDLGGGTEISLWDRVMRGTAYLPEDAAELLTEWSDEMATRGRILRDIATDDDPANDHIVEWCDELAAKHPYRVLFIDEFPVVAALNGKPQGELDLLGPVLSGYRIGRKYGMSVISFVQKTGDKDWGSSVLPSQSNLKISGACSPADAVALFGADRRDRGFHPHLLKPGTGHAINDAGKVYLTSPDHTRPDLYRFFKPMGADEVKASIRRRLAERYLEITAGQDDASGPGEEEAQLVNPLRAALEALYRDRDRARSTEILAHLAKADPAAWGGLNFNTLSNLLGRARPKDLHLPDGTNPKGYFRADVFAALDEMDEREAAG